MLNKNKSNFVYKWERKNNLSDSVQETQHKHEPQEI